MVRVSKHANVGMKAFQVGPCVLDENVSMTRVLRVHIVDIFDITDVDLRMT